MQELLGALNVVYFVFQYCTTKIAFAYNTHEGDGFLSNRKASKGSNTQLTFGLKRRFVSSCLGTRYRGFR